MKRKVLKHLKEYIKKNVYGDYTLFMLFQEYEKQTIKTLDGLYQTTEEFIKFLYKNRDKILKDISYIEAADFEKEFDEIIFAFRHISRSDNVNSTYEFVRLAETLYDDKSATILDVGAGAIPLSSFLFTTSFDEVYSMDKFLLSEEYIKGQGVQPINAYFKKDTNISGYDYIVGKCPCSAIPHIVKNSAKENKPYFLELCDCSLNSIILPNGTIPEKWEDVLFDYDPNITFVGDYALNIDASKSQLIKLIENGQPHHSLNLSFNAINFLASCFKEIVSEQSYQMQ